MQLVINNDQIIATYEDSSDIRSLCKSGEKVVVIPNNIEVRNYKLIKEKQKNKDGKEIEVEVKRYIGFKKYSELQLDNKSLQYSIKSTRDQKLNSSLWILERHQTQKLASIPTSITDQKAVEWAIYFQALRDVTKQPTYPTSVTWPIEPQ